MDLWLNGDLCIFVKHYSVCQFVKRISLGTISKIQRKVEAPCQHCESLNVSPTMVVKYSICLWHDDRISNHEIPREQNHVKDIIIRCHGCGSVKRNFYPPSTDEDENDG